MHSCTSVHQLSTVVGPLHPQTLMGAKFLVQQEVLHDGIHNSHPLTVIYKQTHDGRNEAEHQRTLRPWCTKVKLDLTNQLHPVHSHDKYTHWPRIRQTRYSWFGTRSMYGRSAVSCGTCCSFNVAICFSVARLASSTLHQQQRLCEKVTGIN